MHLLVKHVLVDSDIENAALWYHQRDPAVAFRLVDEIRLAMLSAAENPLRFAERFGKVRRVRVSGFPHSVFFRIRVKPCSCSLSFTGREMWRRSSASEPNLLELQGSRRAKAASPIMGAIADRKFTGQVAQEFIPKRDPKVERAFATPAKMPAVPGTAVKFPASAAPPEYVAPLRMLWS